MDDVFRSEFHVLAKCAMQLVVPQGQVPAVLLELLTLSCLMQALPVVVVTLPAMAAVLAGI